MVKIEDLVKALNGDVFKESSLDYFKRKERFLRPDCKDKDKFILYLKAACIELFSLLDDKHKEELVNEIANYKQIEPPFDHYNINFINVINTNAAKENDFIDEAALEHIKSLKKYEDDPIYAELTSRDDAIIVETIRRNGFTFMKDIKPNIPVKAMNKLGIYVFDEDEINKLNAAKKMSTLSNQLHAIYDEYNGFDKPKLNPDNIDDEFVKAMSFNTGKSNPEFEIVFDDGTIVNYYNGDIRVKPINFKIVIHLVKLSFVELCREDNQNEIERFFCEFDSSVDPFNMTDEEFFGNLDAAFDHIYKDIYRLDEVYSKKMIEDAKAKKEELEGYIKKYNL